MALILKTLALVALVVLVGCQAPSLPATDEHRGLFPGEYSGSMGGGLRATLSITPELSYVYEQDLGEASRLDRIRRAGTLQIKGPKSATAGNVALQWRSKNAVTVRSPHGSRFDPNPLGGGDYSLGHEFTMRRAAGQGEGRVIGTITLALEPRKPECEAGVSISYAQLNTQVSVETTVDHDGCAASGGDYEVRLRTVDVDGDVETRTFAESWSRTDAKPMTTTKLYDIGSGRRLVWAQVSTAPATNCRCHGVEDEALRYDAVDQSALNQHKE